LIGRSGLARFVEAEQQATFLFYEQTIQGAFCDVSDGLIACRK
jgi:hypothetical protein